jgi:hypothetical protein
MVLIDNICHISVDKERVVLFDVFGDHKLLFLFPGDACLTIVVDNVEMCSLIYLTKLHIKDSFVLVVPKYNISYQ